MKFLQIFEIKKFQNVTLGKLAPSESLEAEKRGLWLGGRSPEMRIYFRATEESVHFKQRTYPRQWAGQALSQSSLGTSLLWERAYIAVEIRISRAKCILFILNKF